MQWDDDDDVVEVYQRLSSLRQIQQSERVAATKLTAVLPLTPASSTTSVEEATAGRAPSKTGSCNVKTMISSDIPDTDPDLLVLDMDGQVALSEQLKHIDLSSAPPSLHANPANQTRKRPGSPTPLDAPKRAPITATNLTSGKKKAGKKSVTFVKPDDGPTEAGGHEAQEASPAPAKKRAQVHQRQKSQPQLTQEPKKKTRTQNKTTGRRLQEQTKGAKAPAASEMSDFTMHIKPCEDDKCLRAGDLCYVHVVMWHMAANDAAACTATDEEVQPIIVATQTNEAVVTDNTAATGGDGGGGGETAEAYGAVPHICPDYAIVRVTTIGTASGTIRFQFVYCPVPDRTIQNMIKQGTVVTSPYLVASMITQLGKVHQQPHINGLKFIYKLRRDVIRQLLSGEAPYYVADIKSDVAIADLKHIDSDLQSVPNPEPVVCSSFADNNVESLTDADNAQGSVVEGESLDKPSDAHGLREAARIRVRVEAQQLGKKQDSLDLYASMPLAMMLWGTTSVCDMYSGFHGYLRTKRKLDLPLGWAYVPREGHLVTPTGPMPLHRFARRLVRRITKFRNGFRMGSDGVVWVPAVVETAEATFEQPTEPDVDIRFVASIHLPGCRKRPASSERNKRRLTTASTFVAAHGNCTPQEPNSNLQSARHRRWLATCVADSVANDDSDHHEVGDVKDDDNDPNATSGDDSDLMLTDFSDQSSESDDDDDDDDDDGDSCSDDSS